MSTTDSGAIEKVSVRSIWKNEQYKFTPWLAEEDNMAQLATALGLEHEVEGVEVAVGSCFRLVTKLYFVTSLLLKLHFLFAHLHRVTPLAAPSTRRHERRCGNK